MIFTPVCVGTGTASIKGVPSKTSFLQPKAARSNQMLPVAASTSFECRVSSFETQSTQALLWQKLHNADKTG